MHQDLSSIRLHAFEAELEKLSGFVPMMSRALQSVPPVKMPTLIKTTVPPRVGANRLAGSVVDITRPQKPISLSQGQPNSGWKSKAMTPINLGIPKVGR